MRNNVKVTFLLLMICLALPLRGQDISLDGFWSFKTDIQNVGISDKWYSSDIDYSGWDKQIVPGSWNTQIAYSSYTGIAWYRTSFNIDEFDLSDKDIKLIFDAVYSGAEVWLNGTKLGEHHLAVTRFDFIINHHLIKGENNLVVRVDNTFKLGATWNWGGINRPVKLSILSQNRINNVQITTDLDLKKNKATVNMKFFMEGEVAGSIHMKMTDPNGKIVFKGNCKVNGEEQTASVTLKNPMLWDFNNPHLYTASFTYSADGQKESHVNQRFGVRKVEVDGYRFLLNGESVRLNGANYVPDDRFYGNYLPVKEMHKVIDELKSLGVNMARLSHLALSKEMLDYIDEKGILIFEEIPLWNKHPYVQKENHIALEWLTELITERYNHPCIIGWGVGNEIARKEENPELEDYLKSSLTHVRGLDPSRLAIYVTHTADAYFDEPVLLSDMIMYNKYYEHGKHIDIVHERYPGKPIFMSEFGASTVGESVDDDVDFHSIMNDMRGREYLIGASVWTFNDYRSNYGDNLTTASEARPWGVVDTYGRRKRAFKTLQIENSPLKKFSIEVKKTNQDVSGKLFVKPREVLDIPAYDIKSHKIQISYFTADGEVVNKQIIDLPVLKVGSSEKMFSFSLGNKDIVKIVATLISPLSYEIHSVSTHLENPITPQVNYTEVGDNTIRFYFDKHASVDEYYIKYDGKQTNPTISNCIEINHLAHNTPFAFSLVAVNDQGTTVADPITVKTHYGELPPILYMIRQDQDFIRMGYSSTRNDLAYEFEYGLSPNDLTRKIIHSVRGACSLPLIKENETHFLRFRKLNQYGFSSQWSKIHTIPNATNPKAISK